MQSGGAIAIGIDEFEVSDSCDASGVTTSSSNIVVRIAAQASQAPLYPSRIAHVLMLSQKRSMKCSFDG